MSCGAKLPQELPSPPPPALSTQAQPGKVQSRELALLVAEEGPVPHPERHPFPGGGGQEGETEALMASAAGEEGRRELDFTGKINLEFITGIP